MKYTWMLSIFRNFLNKYLTKFEASFVQFKEIITKWIFHALTISTKASKSFENQKRFRFLSLFFFFFEKKPKNTRLKTGEIQSRGMEGERGEGDR